MNPAFLTLALAFLPQKGEPQAISLPAYHDRLETVRDAMARGDVAEASRNAEWLLDRKVSHDGIEFAPDPTVLRALADASDPDALTSAKDRLSALLAALEGMEPAAPDAPAADRGLLEKLRREEAPLMIREGGALGDLPEPPKSFKEWLVGILEWIGDRIADFLTWLRKLLSSDRGGGGDLSGLRALVWILIVAGIVVLGAIAFVALRRRGDSRRALAAASTAPAQSARDQDPLSRSASGWEQHAAELMKAGRFREAIRAWYHALLVTLFRAGLLHYRKDRTNWEYAYSLSPEVAWRPRFMDATRSFEREWYGRRATTADTASEFQGDAHSLLQAVRGGGAR